MTGESGTRILILEDVPTDAELEERALRQAGLTFTAKLVDNREAFIRALEDFSPDLVLSDYNLPGFTGLEALEIVRKKSSDLPVIIVTGALTDEAAVELVKAGASDYILKDRLARLPFSIMRALTVAKEAGERKAAEAAVKRVNRALKTLSNCNATLVHAISEQNLLKEMCDLIVQVGGYRMAWIGYAENDPDKTVRVQAESGIDGDYLDHAAISWADTDRGHGPTGTAIRTGSVQVNRNSATDEHMLPWRTEMLKLGFSSSIALPLKNGPNVFGTVTIYAGEPDAFNDDEIKLLTELAGDIAYGIQTLRDREQRHAADDKLRRGLESIVGALANTVEKRDPYTSGHQHRVADLAEVIGREMHMAEDRIHGMFLAGLVHDVGKINVPAEILSKPGKLTALEMELVRLHVGAGYDILKGLEFPWPIADMVLQHHERIDGSGYPNGIKGDDMLPEAKILAVADVVEAMMSHRPYRPALGRKPAIDEITSGKGRLYDPSVVDACIAIFNSERKIFD